MKFHVSNDHRRIERADGTPFFYLADTAWELLHRLSREETLHYLRARAAQRFTVVQAGVLSEQICKGPGCNGIALHDSDPLKPNQAFFEHCDWVVEQAASAGLVMALGAAWGNHWVDPPGVNDGCFTPETAAPYCTSLAKRYRGAPVIWFLGGDRPITQPRHWEVLRAMARGLRAGDERALIGFHPSAEQSPGVIFAKEDWLDFSMLQTGHGIPPVDSCVRMMEEYGRVPVRPCLNGEPCYEDHPIMRRPAGRDEGWEPIGDERFGAGDVRRQAWWSLFGGACGHTYGCHSVWQMYRPGRPVINHVRSSWDKALELPGARQMQCLRAFFEQEPFIAWEPDQSLLTETMGPRGEEVMALRAPDAKAAAFYFPQGKPFLVNLPGLRCARVTGTWFDPRTGSTTPADTWDTALPVRVTPPSREEDWVLRVTSCGRGSAA